MGEAAVGVLVELCGSLSVAVETSNRPVPSRALLTWDALTTGALVALLRKGFSNASLMRRTFTWPNPGRLRSCSGEALAMPANDFKCVLVRNFAMISI